MGAVAGFADGALTTVSVAGQELVVVRDGDAWYAFPDRCTHAKRPLSDGEYTDGVVTCIYHGARFDLNRAGKATLPALRPLACHPVTVEGEDVFVDLE